MRYLTIEGGDLRPLQRVEIDSEDYVVIEEHEQFTVCQHRTKPSTLIDLTINRVEATIVCNNILEYLQAMAIVRSACKS